jgi:hypothetical protein
METMERSDAESEDMMEEKEASNSTTSKEEDETESKEDSKEVVPKAKRGGLDSSLKLLTRNFCGLIQVRRIVFCLYAIVLSNDCIDTHTYCS